ncbi:MAG TPA: hypothetical protein VNK03_00395 [Gammaproteobacteria bacterium]|nr:hypothetical protein [Gammaproteobacteria bacterium]
MLAGLLTICGFGFLIWMMYRTIQGNPEAFSKANLSRSFTTVGFLALILIVVVGVAIFILRQGS